MLDPSPPLVPTRRAGTPAATTTRGLTPWLIAILAAHFSTSSPDRCKQHYHDLLPGLAAIILHDAHSVSPPALPQARIDIQALIGGDQPGNDPIKIYEATALVHPFFSYITTQNLYDESCLDSNTQGKKHNARSCRILKA